LGKTPCATTTSITATTLSSADARTQLTFASLILATMLRAERPRRKRHRILRAGIRFGHEVAAGETTTAHSRGLMFVCYQTSIERQFEYIQRRHANDPNFVSGKVRPAAARR